MVVVKRVVDPLEGGVGGHDLDLAIRVAHVTDDPRLVARRLRLVTLDLRLELGGRPAAGRCLEDVDLASPALDVVFAEQAVEEDEGDLEPDAIGASVNPGCQRRTSTRRRAASHEAIARVSSGSNGRPPMSRPSSRWAACLEAWNSHVSSGGGADASKRRAAWRTSALPSGEMQKACRAVRPGASSQAMAGWIVLTAADISRMSRSSNPPDSIARATRSRPHDHQPQKSVGASDAPESRLKKRIVCLRARRSARIVR
jgi:hypothetical protein